MWLLARGSSPSFLRFAVMNRTFGVLTAKTLNEKILHKRDNDELVLLDAREEYEFKTSRLEGALHVPHYTEESDLAELVEKMIAPDADIVCYCLVGGRAVRLAERLENIVDKLTTVPRPAVYLLEGSIAAWALSGYPMVDAEGKATTEVDLTNAAPEIAELFASKDREEV